MTLAVFLVALIGSVVMGLPIAYALLVSGAAVMWQLNLFDSQILAQNVLEGANSFPLLAVPFFMLAGEVMTVGGLSKRIVNLALALVGHVRGGLGYVTVVASCLLASLSGSAVADTAALGSILLPMLIKAGHEKGRAGGLMAAGGIIGPIIPPSIPFVVFGVTANLSIGKLFLAGLVPGVLMGVLVAGAWWLVARKEVTETPPKATGAERLRALRESLWALGLPFLVLFGLKLGWFTPTEAAVVAAVYALFVSTVIYRELKLSQIKHVFVTAAKTTAAIMLMVAAASVSAWLIAVADLPGQLIALLEPFMDRPTTLLIIIMVLQVAIGMVMDLTPTILILAPVLVPLVKAAHIDPIYFGVLFVINGAIGLITPPVGSVLNVVAGVGKMKMDAVVKGVWPFMMAEFVALGLCIAFPQLVLGPLKFFFG